MIFVFLVSAAIFGTGAVGVIMAIIKIYKTVHAEKVLAVIVHCGRGFRGVQTLGYEVRLETGVTYMERSVMSTIFFNWRHELGTFVRIPYDWDNKKLMPHLPITITYLIIFAMILGMGIISFIQWWYMFVGVA